MSSQSEVIGTTVGNVAAELRLRELGLRRQFYKMPPRRHEHLADRKSREWSGTPRGKRSYCERIRRRVPIRFPRPACCPLLWAGV
jgi:hypothetical protein